MRRCLACIGCARGIQVLTSNCCLPQKRCMEPLTKQAVVCSKVFMPAWQRVYGGLHRAPGSFAGSDRADGGAALCVQCARRQDYLGRRTPGVRAQSPDGPEGADEHHPPVWRTVRYSAPPPSHCYPCPCGELPVSLWRKDRGLVEKRRWACGEQPLSTWGKTRVRVEENLAVVPGSGVRRVEEALLHAFIHVHSGVAHFFERLHCSMIERGSVSGFTNRKESEYDCFGAGHSSTSISAAVGMAVGRDFKVRPPGSVVVPRLVTCVQWDNWVKETGFYSCSNGSRFTNKVLSLKLPGCVSQYENRWID